MDNVKIFLALIVLFGVILMIMNGRIALLFWMGVFFMFSRRVNFPYLGDLEPSTVILYFAAILVLPRVLSFFFKNYLLQLLVLGLGLAVGALLNQPTDEYLTWPAAILSIYMFCALSDLYIRNEADLELLSTFFIIVSFVIAITAVIAYAGFADNVIILSDTSPVNMEDGLVLYSKTYGIAYSNSVNGFIPMALVFLYSKKWNNALRWFIFFAITASVFISLKRIAYISYGLSILYIIFRDGKPKWQAILFCGLLVVGGLLFSGKEIGERFQNTENALFGDDSPDANRTVRLEYAWKHFAEHPLIGNGSGSITYVHNGFLEILVNLGVSGIIIIIPWILKPISLLFQQADKRKRDWAVSCLIYLVTLFLFEAVLNRLDIFWIFGLLYAGLGCAEKIYQKTEFERRENLWKREVPALQ